MKPLVGFIPIVGSIQVYFLQQPHLDFNFGGVASILELPVLNGRIKDTIHEQVVYKNMNLSNHLSQIEMSSIDHPDRRSPHCAEQGLRHTL